MASQPPPPPKGKPEKDPYLSRPARKQVVKRVGPQRDANAGGAAGRGRGTGVYNIWYGKWEGDRDRTRVKVCGCNFICNRLVMGVGEDYSKQKRQPNDA